MNLIMSLKYASLVAFLAFGYASLAAAQSPQDPQLAQLTDAAGCLFAEMPAIPDAADATMEQMVATQGAIQAYIEKSNALLGCLEGIAENEEFTAENRQLALEAYNAEVARQETLAENWNVQRTSFLEKQQQ